MLCIQLNSETATDELGGILAQCLPMTCTVNINGTLGAGKTRLVKSIGVAMGIDSERILSPTFTLCNEYRTEARTIEHMDLYRIADGDELIELGFEDSCASESITLIEWGDRFTEYLPDERINISIEIESETSRRVTVDCFGQDFLPFIKCLKDGLDESGLTYTTQTE